MQANVSYYIDGFTDPDDPKTVTASPHDDGRDVVRSICEFWWHRHGDYAQSFDVVIVAPTKFVGRYPVCVESIPHFAVGKPI